MTKLKVVIASNHPSLVEGLNVWLGRNKLVGTIINENNWDDLKKIIENNPNAIIIATIGWIKENPGIDLFIEYYLEIKFKLLCLADKNALKNIIKLYGTGSQSLIAMCDSEEEFLWGFNELVNGKSHISSDLVSAIKDYHLTGMYTQTRKQNIFSFTKRELEVLSLIRQGFTNREISLRLKISKRTVDGYREKILGKTGARNTAQLMSLASDQPSSGIRQGL